MRWSAFSLFGLLSLFAALPQANATGEDYAVLIISRERLEVPTPCEIGVYINDELAARLLQEQTTSFNLPHGTISIRLKQLPGQVPGCQAGMLAPPAQEISLKAGDVLKYHRGKCQRFVPATCCPRILSQPKKDRPIAARAFGSSYSGLHSNVGAAEGCDLLRLTLPAWQG